MLLDGRMYRGLRWRILDRASLGAFIGKCRSHLRDVRRQGLAVNSKGSTYYSIPEFSVPAWRETLKISAAFSVFNQGGAGEASTGYPPFQCFS